MLALPNLNYAFEMVPIVRIELYIRPHSFCVKTLSKIQLGSEERPHSNFRSEIIPINYISIVLIRILVLTAEVSCPSHKLPIRISDPEWSQSIVFQLYWIEYFMLDSKTEVTHCAKKTRRKRNVDIKTTLYFRTGRDTCCNNTYTVQCKRLGTILDPKFG